MAETDAAVLILGETGTGKELVARAIHDHSGRKDHPLVKVNCAALPSSLIESELFGHEKGAFTGAVTQSIGRFVLAGGSTIFLDEIGDLDLQVQTKLLRVLQEGQYDRVGSGKTLDADLRVIAATNRVLRGAMQQGRFRADLLFCLAVFPIEVSLLRARREDIPLLVWHFVAKKQARLGKRIEEISQSTMDRLVEYPWPGNIRELENVVERSMILSPGATLIAEALLLPVEMGARVPEAKSAGIEELLRGHILGVLGECRWPIKGTGAAADRLDMNPSTLRYRMKKLGIHRADGSGSVFRAAKSLPFLTIFGPFDATPAFPWKPGPELPSRNSKRRIGVKTEVSNNDGKVTDGGPAIVAPPAQRRLQRATLTSTEVGLADESLRAAAGHTNGTSLRNATTLCALCFTQGS